ncbi:MAG TPA: hypothetical protein VLH84_02490 [Patescibacteria group bacterium]|nr:hypothetical protein [Patescibacteria group bacterium]
MHETLAIVGGLIVILSGIPYVIDTIKGKTRPNVVSWLTWTILITIGAFAALAAHETKTAIITSGDAIQAGIILLLGLKYGYAKFSLFDGVCLIGAILGLVLWRIFDSPTTAIIATIVIDLIAALPTYRHSWLKPDEETWQTYSVSSLGAAVGLASLTSFSVDSLAYPVYLFLLGVTLAATIIFRRKKKGQRLLR